MREPVCCSFFYLVFTHKAKALQPLQSSGDGGDGDERAVPNLAPSSIKWSTYTGTRYRVFHGLDDFSVWYIWYTIPAGSGQGTPTPTRET